MEENYVPGFTPALQSHPTAQPVQTAPYAGAVARRREYAIDPGYSPETRAYLEELNNYIQAQNSALGAGSFGTFHSAFPTTTYEQRELYLPRGNEAARAQDKYSRNLIPVEESALQSYLGKPLEENTAYSTRFLNNSGGSAGVLTIKNDMPVVLIDDSTGKVVYSGTGFAAAQEAAKKAQELSSSLGKKAEWSVYTGKPGATDVSQFNRVAQETKNKGFLGTVGDILGTALPIAVSFIPGFGQLSLAAKIAAGAAAGGVGAGIKGDNILTGALLGGATQGLVGGTGLDKAVGNVFQGAGGGTGQAIAGGIGQTAGSAAGDIVVTGLSKGAQAAGNALAGGALNTLFNNTLLNTPFDQAVKQPVTQPTAPQPTFDEAFGPGWDVLANTGNLPANVVAGGAGVGAGAINSGLDANGVPEGVGETQEVIGTKKPALPSVPTPPVSGYDPVTNTITAVAEPKKPITDAENEIGVGVPPLTSVNIPPNAGLELPSDGKGLSLTDYLRLAGLAAGLAGDLTGKGSGGKIPGGLGGGLSPIFSSQLPTSNLPPATTRPASLLPQSTQDWYRYGYGPEQSFFSNVPQGAPNTSTAYTGYAEGGSTGTGHGSRSSFAVGGPGDGRDDKIPAMLSDGEYVMDAETVAMLGNGSSKAGADALDKFRVAVRKHKGRDLAKGKFSANAKKPDQYLKGRK